MNPWVNLPQTAPLVLPSDRALIDAFNERANARHRIRTEAIPEPFFGRFDAPIVVLLLNPGFSSDGVHIQESPAFLSAMRAYLTNGMVDHLHLIPGASGPGSDWWTNSARALISATSRLAVAQSVLSLEYFPYHSISYKHAKTRLPSQAFTFDLLDSAIRRKAIVVAARGYRIWVEAVPHLATYDQVLRLKSPQRMSLSPRNLGEIAFSSLVAAVNAPAVA